MERLEEIMSYIHVELDRQKKMQRFGGTKSISVKELKSYR